MLFTYTCPPERYGEYLIWTYSQNTQLVFQGKSLSYYDRAKSMTDLSGVGSIIGVDASGLVMEITCEHDP